MCLQISKLFCWPDTIILSWNMSRQHPKIILLRLIDYTLYKVVTALACVYTNKIVIFAVWNIYITYIPFYLCICVCVCICSTVILFQWLKLMYRIIYMLQYYNYIHQLPFADSGKRLTICIICNGRDRFIQLYLIVSLGNVSYFLCSTC